MHFQGDEKKWSRGNPQKHGRIKSMFTLGPTWSPRA